MFGLKEIWGLDIGSSVIKATKLVRVKGQMVVSDWDMVDVENFEGFDGEEEEYQYEKVKRAILNLVNRKHLRDAKVAIVLPGHSAMVKKIQFPTIDVKRVEKMINFEAAQQIPFPLEEVVWDYQMLGVADSGAEYEVALFAIKKGLVSRYLDIMAEAHLDVEVLQVAPMALYNFINFDIPPEEDENIILLDVGAQNSDLIICSGNNFLIRNIPTAGEDITKAFQRKFSVGFEEAEKIKHELTDSKQSQKLFDKVVEPIMNELVGDMQRTINYFRSQYSGVDFSGIITSGATFGMPGTLQYIADRFQIGVINIDELERISVAMRDVDGFYANLPRMALSLGGALQGIGEGPVTTNLLPTDIRTEKVFERKRPYAIVSLAMIVLTLLVSYWVGSSTRSFYRSEIGVKEDLAETAGSYEDDYLALEKKIKPVAQRCVSITDIDGMLKDVGEGEQVLARYAYLKAFNALMSKVAEFNTDDESQSLWMDEISIQVIPDSWDTVSLKVRQLMGNQGGRIGLGQIEELLNPQAGAGGGGMKPGMPNKPGKPVMPAKPSKPGMAKPGAATTKADKLLLVFMKGRTRQRNPYVLKFKEGVDQALSSILFTTKSGDNKVGGQMVYQYSYVEEMKNVPRMTGGSGFNAGPAEQREYMIFDIVWVARLADDSNKAEEAPAGKPAGRRTAPVKSN